MENEEIEKELLRLVERSEERIDKTNEMVTKIADLMQSLTETYKKHLDTLAASRDRLIEIHAHDQEQVRELQRELIDSNRRTCKMVEMLTTAGHGVNLNNNFNK